MSVLLLLIPFAVAIAAVVWWKLRRPADSTPTPSLPRTASPSKPAPPAPAQPAREAPALSARASAALAEPMPPVLEDFFLTMERALPESQLQALMTVIGGIPRPPLSLHKLLAPDFFEHADSVMLSELLMGEPLIAAKVLATVNSPFYGLHQPVNSMEPAITFLGMDTVRNICVQYMLAQAFKPELRASQRSFDTIWRSSSIASELCLHLGKALDLPDPGALATKVVMVFVGHLAAASLLPHNTVQEWLLLDRLHRAKLEQEVIGLSAGEIGSLVLRTWELPSSLVSDVSATSRVLVTPANAAPAQQVPLLGLGYLCVGLGERLAMGHLSSLGDVDLWGHISPDYFHLRSYLTHPALAALPEVLRSQPIEEAVQQMLGKGAAPH